MTTITIYCQDRNTLAAIPKQVEAEFAFEMWNHQYYVHDHILKQGFVVVSEGSTGNAIAMGQKGFEYQLIQTAKALLLSKGLDKTNEAIEDAVCYLKNKGVILPQS